MWNSEHKEITAVKATKVAEQSDEEDLSMLDEERLEELRVAKLK